VRLPTLHNLASFLVSSYITVQNHCILLISEANLPTFYV